MNIKVKVFCRSMFIWVTERKKYQPVSIRWTVRFYIYIWRDRVTLILFWDLSMLDQLDQETVLKWLIELFMFRTVSGNSGCPSHLSLFSLLCKPLSFSIFFFSTVFRTLVAFLILQTTLSNGCHSPQVRCSSCLPTFSNKNKYKWAF